MKELPLIVALLAVRLEPVSVMALSDLIWPPGVLLVPSMTTLLPSEMKALSMVIDELLEKMKLLLVKCY